MLAKYDVRHGEALEQTVVDHGLGALRGLLTRLEDGHQGAFPGVTRLRQQGRRAHQPGHVYVVAAHVTDWHGIAFGVLRRDLAGIGKSSGLGDRKRVHVGAQHHRGPGTVT